VTLTNAANLDIVNTDPRIVETGQELKRGTSRIFPVIGVKIGSAMIEARKWGPTPDAGAAYAHFEVQVLPRRPDYGPVAFGQDAASRAIEILKISTTMPRPMPYMDPLVGTIQFEVGQVWEPHKRLILSADHQLVVYLEGETLFSARTADVAREILLDAVAEGANRARPMAEASRVVMQFIVGIFVGPAVQVAATIIVLTMACGAHREEIGLAIDKGPETFNEIKLFRDECPTAWAKINEKIKVEAPQFLYEAFIQTVTDPKNIAFFLGRVIRCCLGKGFFDITIGAEEVAKLTLGKFAKYVVECAVLVVLLHLPEGILDLAGEMLKSAGQQIKTGFAKRALGSQLTDDEAKNIAKELARFTQLRLDKLANSVGGYQALVEKLARELKKSRD